MQEIRKLLKLNKNDYYKVHLSLINAVLPVKMTPKEIEVLAAFMGLEGDLARYRFGPSARKIVMQQLQLSPAGLSNFIGSTGSLTEKGFIIKKTDIIEIFPLLIPKPDEQIYIFKLQKLEDANSNS